MGRDDDEQGIALIAYEDGQNSIPMMQKEPGNQADSFLRAKYYHHFRDANILEPLHYSAATLLLLESPLPIESPPDRTISTSTSLTPLPTLLNILLHLLQQPLHLPPQRSLLLMRPPPILLRRAHLLQERSERLRDRLAGALQAGAFFGGGGEGRAERL